MAMNAAQQECIQDLIDQARRNDGAVERAFGLLESRPDEPLFIRNLENVQGDERDIVIISYTYAPREPGGALFQRFGPLNTEGGERRFNVLITRAKWRMEVFSSIRSDQIIVAEKKPGVQHFALFLKYAETGRLDELGVATGAASESPFESMVEDVLRAAGFSVDRQVGVAGYFIDLAVRHPRDAGRFAIGIECDGATYHSSRAARDRDRLRERILQDRGWKLYRVWSTDWFLNHDLEAKSLVDAVRKQCEICEAV